MPSFSDFDVLGGLFDNYDGWPSGKFMVGYVPVTWELSAKIKASIDSDARLSKGSLALKANARLTATLGGMYCAPGYIERSSECYSAQQTGFTPINTVVYSPPTMSGEAEPIEFDSSQLLSTTDIRFGVDVTLTLWGLLPITVALRNKLGFVVASPSETGSIDPSAHPELGYREYQSSLVLSHAVFCRCSVGWVVSLVKHLCIHTYIHSVSLYF